MEGESFTDKLIPPFLSEDCLLDGRIYLKIMNISERKGNIMTKKKKYGKVQVKNFKWIYSIPSSDNHYICEVLCTADRCDAYNIIYKMGWI